MPFDGKFIFTENFVFMATTEELKRIASQVRRDIVRMVHAVNSGHPGGSMGCTEFFVALYFDLIFYEFGTKAIFENGS
mgnify:CR=1 FL=1